MPSGKKILVVEDDPLNALILHDYLEANGYDICVATNGPEGIERFHTEAPDLMLIDVQLPRKNGFEVYFEIRQTPRGRDLPVLMMSAVYANREYARPYAEKGLKPDGYLTKPFELKYLLGRVQQLIGAA